MRIDFKRSDRMKNGTIPDPNLLHPITGYDKEIYIHPAVTSKNIIVGDFS